MGLFIFLAVFFGVFATDALIWACDIFKIYKMCLSKAFSSTKSLFIDIYDVTVRVDFIAYVVIIRWRKLYQLISNKIDSISLINFNRNKLNLHVFKFIEIYKRIFPSFMSSKILWSKIIGSIKGIFMKMILFEGFRLMNNFRYVVIIKTGSW